MEILANERSCHTAQFCNTLITIAVYQALSIRYGKDNTRKIDMKVTISGLNNLANDFGTNELINTEKQQNEISMQEQLSRFNNKDMNK